ncbi:MAG: ferrous iron transporter B, partial [Candidatus Methanomethyliaceae archaeon]
VFLLIFSVGSSLSAYIDEFFVWMIESIRPHLQSFDPIFSSLLLDGVIFGLGAATSIALPYVALFYLLLSILEDTGYLPRAAFLLDSLMHKIGLHGKAFIPMLLGYGCSVPACIGCRIMETRRERLLLGALVVLIPCSARTVIILGVAGSYLGPLVALSIYALDLLIVFLIGKLLFKVLPEEPVGLIMEMPPLRMFSITLVLKKTWVKTKDFVYIALPLIVLGSFVVSLASSLNLVDLIVNVISPVTVGLLGLPVATGIAFIFGFLRKELALIMLATYVGTTDFSTLMTPAQMIAFTLVMVLYIPCIATLSALIKEYGLKNALAITLMDVTLALFIGSVGIRVLMALGL